MPNDQFAPSWMPRSQRRHVNRALSKLFRRDNCSICGAPFKHNSPTAPGLDARGHVVLAGECCANKVAQIFGMSLYQSTGSGTDRIVDDMMRHGGDMPIIPKLVLGDHAWKTDDRLWFERNPKRSHRIRMPFPGEADQQAVGSPSGSTLMILVRQLAPGSRARPAACCRCPTTRPPVTRCSRSRWG